MVRLGTQLERPDATTPVVLLQGVSDAVHHGLLAVARSLGRLGVPVFTISRRWEAVASRSRYVRGAATLDLSQSSADRLVEVVTELVGPAPAPVLIAMDDVAALYVANQSAIRSVCRFPSNTPGLLCQLSNKRGLLDVLRRLEIPAPRMCAVSNDEELGEAARTIGFPIVLKSADPLALRARAGAKSVTVATSLDALIQVYRSSHPSVRARALVQEHIGGEGAADWIFNGCFGEAGTCLFYGTGLKLRQWPLGTGAATLGISLPNPEVHELSVRLARGVGYAGMIDIDYRFDPSDGKYKVLDVNPRVGSSFRLFVGDEGIDVPRAHYLDVTGQPVPPSEAATGRKWVVEQRDLRSAFELWGGRRVGAREWLHSFAGVKETAWFASDDLGPFAAMLAHYGKNAVRRLSAPRFARRPSEGA
jgi:predicted ATP-grasp superfamily ATP-dependent carboligase